MPLAGWSRQPAATFGSPSPGHWNKIACVCPWKALTILFLHNLVGLPMDEWPVTVDALHRRQGSSPNNTHKKPSPVDTWDTWTEGLEHAPEEPQELDLLGASKMNYCVKFYYKPRWGEWDSRMVRPDEKGVVVWQNVTPHHSFYKREKNWCNYTFPITSRSSLHPKRLPKGVFLVCRDRAWPRIPSHLQGGPCSRGQLALLTPDIALIQGWKSQLAPKRMNLTKVVIAKLQIGAKVRESQTPFCYLGWLLPKLSER